MPNRIGVERLRRFSGRLYGCFDRRADALFEVCDAILAAGTYAAPRRMMRDMTYLLGIR